MSDPAAPADMSAAIKGQARVRQILAVVLGLALVILAGAFVFLYFHKMRFAYFAWLRRADLIYVTFWMSITAVGLIGTMRRRWTRISYIVLLLLFAEGGSQAYVYFRSGFPYQPDQLAGRSGFEPHPLLVGIPKPGVFDGVVHTPEHGRRTFNENKIANPNLIFAFGGSTTYEISVNDDMATWTSDLSRLLGSGFAVENYGVPGYSSAENLIQTLFAFRDRKPVCAIYLVGGNDLRNAWIKNLRVDYSDFHLPSQVAPLSLRRRNFLVNNMVFLQLVGDLVVPEQAEHFEGAPSDQFDPRLSKIFTENMSLIANIAHHFGVKVLLALEPVYFSDSKPNEIDSRALFVRNRDLKPFLHAMDQDLEDVARATGAAHLESPQLVAWQPMDFIDNKHFTPEGSLKFAQAIAPDVARECR